MTLEQHVEEIFHDLWSLFTYRHSSDMTDVAKQVVRRHLVEIAAPTYLHNGERASMALRELLNCGREMAAGNGGDDLDVMAFNVALMAIIKRHFDEVMFEARSEVIRFIEQLPVE